MFLLFLFLFPIIALTKIILVILGLFIVAISIPFGRTIRPAPEWQGHSIRHIYDGWEFRALPKWSHWIWGSDKYGAYGNFIWGSKSNPRSFFSQYEWLALRNPASNINNFTPFSPLYYPNELKYKGKAKIGDAAGIDGYQFVWIKGMPIFGFYWIIRYGKSNKCLRIRIGYKLEPTKEGPQNANLSILINPFNKFGE